MRKIVAEIAVSLDGFIEGPKGELDWMMFNKETNYANNLLKRFDTIFYGRKTYQRFGLPRTVDQNKDEQQREFDMTINTMRKYVFTNSLTHVPGNGMVIRRNIIREVERIRDEDGKDIWLCGGASMIKTFASLSLIDEYLIAVHPIILSEGKPLFANVSRRISLKLQSTETLSSGIVILNYQPN